MFETLGPLAAHNALRRFLMDNPTGYDPIRESLIRASEEVSAVPALTAACEILLAGLVETEMAEDTRTAALHLLGTLSAACGAGYYYHPTNPNRWSELGEWAASELNDGDADAPDVDPARTTIQPEAPAEE